MASLFENLSSPAVALLNNLKFTKKFALIFLLNFLPISFILYNTVSEDTRAIAHVERERHGLEYMAALRPLFEHMAQTRGMTNAYLNGKTALKGKIEDKRALVTNELDELLSVDKKLGKALQTGDKAASIQRDWNEVVRRAFTMPPKQAFTAHTELVRKVLELKMQVYESSNLMLDSALDNNLMANVLSVRIPTLAENMGRARGMGAGIAAAGRASLENNLKLAGFIHNIGSANDAMMNGLGIVFEENPAMRDQLASATDVARSATKKFIDVTRQDILNATRISIDSNAYFALGSDAIAANLKLYDVALPALDGVLRGGIENLKHEMLISVLFGVALLVVTVGLLSGFYFSLMGSINQVKEAVHRMAEGDLTVTIKLQTKDEMQFIATDMNLMIEKTNALVSQVISATNQVVKSSDMSASASENTRSGVNQQNMEIEQVATAMNQMSATVHEVANNASNTAQATRDADKEANNGRAVVNKTIESINSLASEMQQATGVIKQLEADSESIGTVLDVIRGIAEQTNLLALNAAIEAARAGEQGRGFAVVADEVRTLASRTQESTQEIQGMIEKLQQGSQNAVKVMEAGSEQTEKTVTSAADAGVALESIASAVDHITTLNEQIASAAEEQSSVAEEINRNVVNVQGIASETANNADQTADCSDSVKEVASQLKALVKEFKVA
ncbi:MAG TPA: methyl-accepting chemotaxis protein [Gammaproteobacteria bacterium]|nr:methyl-accepting chemotaxis protein [Gammaproteobacteria bacterium]